MATRGLSDQIWVVTVPNGQEADQTTLASLAKGTQDRGLCRLHKFEVPSLHHGTLDSLIALSDDLGKMNQQVEGVVRKVERQYLDTIAASGAESEELKVEDTPIEAYMRNWKWDMARYQHQGKKLTDLTSQILGMAGQMDEELKKLTAAHTEKTQALAALDRKKNVNISTSDFEDFLTPEVVSRLDVLDNEHLQTLFVAMPKAVEAEFLRDYVKIGASMDFMFKDEKLCVVAPDSAKLVMAQGEQVLYTITAIKGHYEAGYFDSDHVPDVEVQLQTGQCRDRRASSGAYVPGRMVDFIEPLKHKFREKRMIVRSFKYDESKTGGVEGLLENARRDVADSQIKVIRWCKVTFGMLFPGLIHLKVITCFAESVLRYGVPINFLAVFLDPNLKKEKELKAALLNTITHMRPELKLGKLDKDEEEDDDPENLPYVCHAFSVIGVKGV